jgi:AcrR family transcriptional regulator
MMDHPPTITSAGRTKRQERAERILNVAEELLLKHGYQRITIDDIADQSEIGKGTIYLHWKSKEALFGTLFLREVVAIWTELLERMHAAPEQVSFSQVLRSMMLIGMRRPIARALFTWDRELLGKLVESGVGPRHQTEQVFEQGVFLDMLRKQGMIRSDQDPIIQSYALRATITGFLMIESPQAGENQLSLEQRADALAQTIHAAFEPEPFPQQEKLAKIITEMDGWLGQLIAAFNAKIQESMK